MQSETERAIISRFNEENLTTLREAKVAVPEQMWTEEEAKERAWEEMVEMLNLEEGVDSVR